MTYYRIISAISANHASLIMPTEYMDNIVHGFGTIGMGSSLMHGYRVTLGGVFDGGAFDIISISVISHFYFQHVSSRLTANVNTLILHELSIAPRARDGREFTTPIYSVQLELGNWLAALRKLDYFKNYITFFVIMINCFTLVMTDFLGDKLFIPDTYVPAVRIGSVRVSPAASPPVRVTGFPGVSPAAVTP